MVGAVGSALGADGTALTSTLASAQFETENNSTVDGTAYCDSAKQKCSTFDDWLNTPGGEMNVKIYGNIETLKECLSGNKQSQSCQDAVNRYVVYTAKSLSDAEMWGEISGLTSELYYLNLYDDGSGRPRAVQLYDLEQKRTKELMATFPLLTQLATQELQSGKACLPDGSGQLCYPIDSRLPTAVAQQALFWKYKDMQAADLQRAMFVASSAPGALAQLLGADEKTQVFAAQIGAIAGDMTSAVVVARESRDLQAQVLRSNTYNTLKLEAARYFIGETANIRAGLSGDDRTSGNIGIADINIPGVQPRMIASSRIEAPTDTQINSGFVGTVENPHFASRSVPTASGYNLPRDTDSEPLILNNIALQLHGNTQAKGTVVLFTERPPCASCQSVIANFQATFKNINLHIIDSQGVVKPATPPKPGS